MTTDRPHDAKPNRSSEHGKRFGCSYPAATRRPPGLLADVEAGVLGLCWRSRGLPVSSFATNSFATPNNLFNVTRNFTFTAVIALGMTIVIISGGIDLSVGSVLCLCSMILAVVMHAGYSIESESPRRWERR